MGGRTNHNHTTKPVGNPGGHTTERKMTMKQNDLKIINETIRELYTRDKNYIGKSVTDFSAPAGIFFAPVQWPSDFYERQDERIIHIIGSSLLKTRKGAEKRAIS